MRKKGWKLIGGIICLIILCSVYIIVKNSEKADNEADNETEIMDIKSENVTLLDIKNGENEITFVKNDDTWEVEGEEEFPLEQSKIEEVIENFKELKTSRIIEEPEDVSEYELDQGKEVMVQTEDQEETIIRVGMKNSSTSQYYIQIGEDSNVYLVDGNAFSFIDQGLYDYAARNEFPVIASSEIRKVQVKKENNSYVYSYQGVEDSNSSWSVGTDESSLQAGDGTKIGTLNTALNSLSYVDFVDYHCESPEKYGFQQPKAVITVDYETTTTVESDEETDEESDEETITENHTVMLTVGNTDENGNYYVYKDDSLEVYTVSQSTIDNFLAESAATLLDKTVSYVNMEDMETLQIESDGKTYLLEIQREASEETEEEDSATVKYYVNEEEVESSSFTSFYSKLITESGQERDDSLSTEGLEADLELHFTKSDGSKIDVVYYGHDASFYLAVNGEKKLLVNKMDVKEIKDALIKLAEKEE